MTKVLEYLVEKGVKLFIVTKKREKPTKLIIDYLPISHFFSGIYCSDTKQHYKSKANIVQDVLMMEDLNAARCVFIGDTEQDRIAAESNKTAFIYAAYGYGNLQNTERSITMPTETLNFINYKDDGK